MKKLLAIVIGLTSLGATYLIVDFLNMINFGEVIVLWIAIYVGIWAFFILFGTVQGIKSNKEWRRKHPR